MDRLEPGVRFEDRYLILGEVGAGSFGRVYRARQLSTGQDVALKLLHQPDVDTPAERELVRRRFARELATCATLAHPNIVRLLDSGEWGDRLYAVFEFVPGVTLREVLAMEQRLSLADTLALMTEVLDALACAHASGVVHRDLKPENIMLTRTGARRHAKVLDFGLAALSAGDDARRTRLTATGELLGTPSYAAPEQLRGEPVTGRSDLYAWGLIFVECLTGEIVMNGRTAYEALTKQLADTPVPLPAWLRDQRLGNLLATATAKNPAARDVTAAGLLEALEQVGHRLAALPPTAPLGDEERRHVTVVTFAVQAARQDGGPLDVAERDGAERAQLAAITRLVQDAEGTLTRGRTGRLTAVFGYPRAREHDARRAVQLALRVVGDEPASGDGALRVRTAAGIHCGVALARMEPPGADGAACCEVAGEPVALSARLAARAETGSVLATNDVRALIAAGVPAELDGEIDLPDSGTAMPVVRMLRDRPAARAETTATRRDAALAGRVVELGRLQAAWARVQSESSTIVLVEGEPGIGKSRLVRELRRAVPDGDWLECRCLPEDQGSPLRPLIQLLTDLHEPLEHLVRRIGCDLAETVPLLGSLLGLPDDPRFPEPVLSPERKKELTLKAVCSVVTRLAMIRPLVLAIEDLHWADPSTLELLQLLVEELRAVEMVGDTPALRLLLLLTARPEFGNPWGAGDVTLLPLERLPAADVARLVTTQWTGTTPVSPELVRQIAARSDGVPLFIEELVHVLATGPAMPGSELVIPATLRELLAGRLDTLSPSAHETAQLAAALGRDFPHALLAAAAERSGRTAWMLRRDLQELLDGRLLYRRSAAEAYVFKHALVRDAAYESMTDTVRLRVHQTIAAAIDERLPALPEDRPETLAYHLERGGDALRASDYWYRAGDRARRRAAYVEAIEHLEHGLKLLPGIPESPERRRRELELLLTLGTVHFSTKGYGAAEVGETFGRARELCGDVGTDDASLKTLTGLVSMYLIRGDRDATEELLPKCRALAERAPGTVARVFGQVALGAYAFWQGDHGTAARWLEQARGLYRTDEFRRYTIDYGWDGGVFAHGYAVWNGAIVADPRATATQYRELLALAEASFDPYSLPLALGFGMAAAQVLRDVDETQARATRLIEVSGVQRMYLWLAVGQCGCGWALARQGAVEPGINLLRQGLDLYRLTGAMTPYAYYLSFLAEALLLGGRIDDGLAVVAEGLTLCEQTLGRLAAPELLRLRGELLRAGGDVRSAEATLREALDSASRRGATVWHVRAAASLARLLADLGRRDEGHAALHAVVGEHTGLASYPDLDDARALLAG